MSDLDLASAVIGYVMQYLRALPGFKDWMYVIASAALSLVLSSYMLHGGAWENPAVVKDAARILFYLFGGTMTAHIASHAGAPAWVAPKYNQFKKEKTDE